MAGYVACGGRTTARIGARVRGADFEGGRVADVGLMEVDKGLAGELHGAQLVVREQRVVAAALMGVAQVLLEARGERVAGRAVAVVEGPAVVEAVVEVAEEEDVVE